MSVLDFFVSKFGYMANSYLTDESTDVLVEAAGDEIALDNCVDKWLAKIRELGAQGYDLQFNTDMRPATVQELVALNEHIRILSDQIADQACFMNACHEKYAKCGEDSVYCKVRPLLIHFTSHKGELIKWASSTGFSTQAPELRIVSDFYRLLSTVKLIEAETCTGLSTHIVDISELLNLRDEYALEVLYSYNSFSDLFNELIGDATNPRSPFNYSYLNNGESFINCMLDAAKHKLCKPMQPQECDDVLCFSPYKAVAKTSLDNLDELYGQSAISETLYYRLTRMAYTVINAFNILWLVGCTCMESVMRRLKREEAVDAVINQLHVIMAGAQAQQPISEEAPVENAVE